MWANISRRAKICGQISADAQRSALGKYQKTFEDLWANISRHVKISGIRVVWAQNTITALCSISDTIWLSLIDQFYWEREGVDLNFALLQLSCCSHFLLADLACLFLSLLNFKANLYTNLRWDLVWIVRWDITQIVRWDLTQILRWDLHKFKGEPFYK